MAKYLKTSFDLTQGGFNRSDFNNLGFKLITDCDVLIEGEFNYTYECDYSLDTRLNHYNSYVNLDFNDYDFDMMNERLNEINKNSYFSIIHYKTKRFYIVANYELFNETDDSYTYIQRNNKETRKVLKELINCLEGTLIDQNLKSYIFNELGIVKTDDFITSDNLFDVDFLLKNYSSDGETRETYAECILNLIDYDALTLDIITNYNTTKLQFIVSLAYTKLLALYKKDADLIEYNFNALLNYNLALA